MTSRGYLSYKMEIGKSGENIGYNVTFPNNPEMDPIYVESDPDAIAEENVDNFIHMLFRRDRQLNRLMENLLSVA